MKLPSLNIGDFEVPVPIIQGGMGVGVIPVRPGGGRCQRWRHWHHFRCAARIQGARFPSTDNDAANIRGLEKKSARPASLRRGASSA